MAQPIQDQYVVLLERNIEENRLQRETTTKVLDELKEERRENEELRKRLAALEQKTPSPKSRKQRAEKVVQVPTPCKRKARSIYNELKTKDDFNGFDFTQTFSSATNNAVVKRVAQAVVGACGENTFTYLQVEESLRTYFRSLKEKEKRATNGSEQAHRKKCRRQIRLREKCDKMRKALDISGWEPAAKEEAKEILYPEFMSSEESGVEADENVFNVSKLPWERKKLRVVKRKLRKLYDDSLTERQRQSCVKRIRTNNESSRPVPKEAPAWAVRLGDDEEQ